MLRVLRLYLKVAIFQPELREHAPHTTSVLKSCDFSPGAAGARSAYYVCTQKLRFSSRSCRGPGGESNPRLRDCESRRPFREQQKCTAPQRERFDTQDLRRGSRGHRKKTQSTSSFCASTTPIPAEGRAGTAKKKQKNLEFLHLDDADLLRGSRGHIKKRKTP